MPIISAKLGVTGLSDVGYQFFDSSNALIGSRLTAGVVEAPGATGDYRVNATFPGTEVGVYWNDSVTTTAKAVEVFDSRDSSGITTLLSRIGAALAITSGKVDVNDKTGFALTAGERTAIANEVEAQIIDETDSEKVLAAITDKIAAVNPDLGGLTVAAIASAVWASVSRTLTDKTGFSLSQAFPSNFALFSIDGSGRVLLQPTQTGVTIPTVTNLTNGGGLTAQQIRDAMKLAPGAGAAATASIDSKLDDLVVSGGSGAYTITVTVTDGVDALQGAAVRVTEGATTQVLLTDVNGEAEFALDAASYRVAVTKAGYSFAPSTRTVTGEEAGTLTSDLEMTAVAIPAAPAEASLCTVYGYLETLGNVPASGVAIDFTVVKSGKVAAAKSERNLTVLPVRVITDTNGFFETTLQRNDLITPAGTKTRVVSVALGLDKEVSLEASTFDLAELIT